MDGRPYTTQLQAGLGLVRETMTLLDLWLPGMSTIQLYEEALNSGRFPTLTARRLRNVVVECFAPRYLTANARPAACLKRLSPTLSTADLTQLMLMFTSRASPILGDFVREVYWPRYAGGYMQLTNGDARVFVEKGINDGRTVKHWSEATVRRVSAYLTGCCADYGLLEPGSRSTRCILPFRISSIVAAYLAYELHFAGVGDRKLLMHQDWQLFGLNPDEVLEQIKGLSRKGLLIVQAGGEVIRMSWMKHDMEALYDALA